MTHLGTISIRYLTVLVFAMAILVTAMALLLWAFGGAPVLAFAALPAMVAAYDGGRGAAIRWGGMRGGQGWLLSLLFLAIQAVVSLVMIWGIQALYNLAFTPPEGFGQAIGAALLGYLILIRIAVWLGASRAQRQIDRAQGSL